MDIAKTTMHSKIRAHSQDTQTIHKGIRNTPRETTPSQLLSYA